MWYNLFTKVCNFNKIEITNRSSYSIKSFVKLIYYCNICAIYVVLQCICLCISCMCSEYMSCVVLSN